MEWSLPCKSQIANKLFKGESMIRAAISFFILAIVAYVLGANGVAGISIEIGKLLLAVFLVLAIISCQRRAVSSDVVAVIVAVPFICDDEGYAYNRLL